MLGYDFGGFIMSKASAYFAVGDISGKHDIKELKRELDRFHGVSSVSIDIQNKYVAVDFDTTGIEPERIQNKIEKLGFDVLNVRLENHVM